MNATDDTLLLVTGATGLVGSHVVERARQQGIPVRAFVRRTSNVKLLQKWDVEWVLGSMTEPYALKAALNGVTHVVHCAAMVGDWGHIKHYRQVNVEGLESFLEAARECPTLNRFVHISSLGVYPAGHHNGTDESAAVSRSGIDAYTLSKVEAEDVLRDYVRREKVPALALRPGFIYGPRDRTVLPRMIERMRDGKATYLGDGLTVLNNTYVGNLVDAVFLALDRQDLVGEFFNIRDERLVTKQEFFETIAELGGLPKPSRHIPLGVAQPLSSAWEWLWRTIGKDSAPLLSQATVKFLGYNLDFSIEKAKKQLRFKPRVDFREGMQTTMEWYRSKRKV